MLSHAPQSGMLPLRLWVVRSIPVTGCFHTVTLGPRAFYSSGPASWNSLSTELRHPDLTLGTFERQLKAVLFSSM